MLLIELMILRELNKLKGENKKMAHGNRYRSNSLVYEPECYCWFNSKQRDHQDDCEEKYKVFKLPHQCDAWTIGTLEDALIFKNDLEKLIDQVIEENKRRK